MESQLKTNNVFRLKDKSFLNTILAIGPKWKHITDHISRIKNKVTSKDIFFEMCSHIRINTKWF